MSAERVDPSVCGTEKTERTSQLRKAAIASVDPFLDRRSNGAGSGPPILPQRHLVQPAQFAYGEGRAYKNAHCISGWVDPPVCETEKTKSTSRMPKAAIASVAPFLDRRSGGTVPVTTVIQSGGSAVAKNPPAKPHPDFRPFGAYFARRLFAL